MKQAVINVKGRVQGVNFRNETKKKADLLGLTGFVKNMPDGSVQIMAQGEKNAIEQLIAWCNEGPAHANVADIVVEWDAPMKQRTSFDIEY